MNKEKVIEYIVNSDVVMSLKKYGFTSLSKNYDGLSLKRDTKAGFDRVYIGVSDFGGLINLQFGFGKRINSIEDICIKFIEPIFNLEEAVYKETVGLNHIEELKQSVDVYTMSEVNSFLSNGIKIIEKSIFPLFEKYENLSALGKDLNSNPEVHCLLTSWGYRRLEGIIVAKLIQDSKYDDLKSTYRQQIAQATSIDSLPAKYFQDIYERLIKYLDTI